ncbi:MAG TPA: acyltransferase, partial [Acidobacteriota bacterium]
MKPASAETELLPRRGNRFTKLIGDSVLAALGWQIQGQLPAHNKIVAIAAPHTSNWDFVIGIAVVAALRLDVLWLGKHSIFRRPFR